MKKLKLFAGLITLLSLILCISLSACGNSAGGNTKDETVEENTDKDKKTEEKGNSEAS